MEEKKDDSTAFLWETEKEFPVALPEENPPEKPKKVDLAVILESQRVDLREK